MNITENNKLIAEFMLKQEPTNNFAVTKKLGERGFDIYTHQRSVYFTTEELKFNKDWNWLIEVIEKILSLKNVYAQERQKVFNCISPNIEKTYTACVEFIKWYSKQK